METSKIRLVTPLGSIIIILKSIQQLRSIHLLGTIVFFSLYKALWFKKKKGSKYFIVHIIWLGENKISQYMKFIMTLSAELCSKKIKVLQNTS